MDSLVLGIAVALFITIPLAWKWQLGVKRVAIFILTVGSVCGLVIKAVAPVLAPLTSALFIAGVTLALATLFLAYRFYRDPERSTPASGGMVLSPADGTVIYIRQSARGEIPVVSKRGSHRPLSELLKTNFEHTDCWVIGISMSLLDVHVNRSPIKGTVTFIKHFPGSFLSLRRVEGIFENERMTTIIQSGSLQIAIVQIASRLVRQIVSYVTVGDQLAAGQRLGAIRLGSQVDIVMPSRSDLTLRVGVGDIVSAGQTVLASLPSSDAG